jgi:hypothetical protein
MIKNNEYIRASKMVVPYSNILVPFWNSLAESEESYENPSQNSRWSLVQDSNQISLEDRSTALPLL